MRVNTSNTSRLNAAPSPWKHLFFVACMILVLLPGTLHAAGVAPVLEFNRMPVFSNLSGQTITGTRTPGSVLAVSADTAASVGAVGYPTSDSWSVRVTSLAEGDNVFTFVLTSETGEQTQTARSLKYCGTRGVGTGRKKVIETGSATNFRLNQDGTVSAWGYNGNGLADYPSTLTGVLDIAAGDIHAVAVKSDHTVVAWGDNWAGNCTVPAGLSGVVSVAAGSGHSLALKSDGTVVAWGGNYNGQTDVPHGLADVVAVAAGGDFSMALKSDGTVVAWGNDATGIVTASAGLSGVVAISAGYGHAVALKYDGTVSVFGRNFEGETNLPEGLSDVVAISAKSMHTLALRADGTVVAWGSNYAGGLTIPAEAVNVVAIAAGDSHFLVMKSDGSLVSWGDNGFGQTTFASDLTGIAAISADGNRYGLALKSNGTVFDWGSMGASNAPVDLTDVTAVAAAQDNAIALKSDGTVTGWGGNWNTGFPAGLSGVASIAAGGTGNFMAVKTDGTVVGWGGAVPVPDGLTEIASVAAGRYHSLALKTDGTVTGWGWNLYGEATPPAGLSGVVAVAVGERHSLALKSNGTVVAWGSNWNQETSIPEGLTDVVAISAGADVSLALKSDGTVVALGPAWTGVLDQPQGLNDVVAVAAGYASLALKADGTVVSWGEVALKGENTGIVTPLTGPPVAFVHPVTGAYNKPVSVTLSADRPATIYYTTDGSIPTQSSAVYSGPVTVDSTTVVRFLPIGEDGRAGQLRSGTYVIDTVPPVVEITSPLAGSFCTASPLLGYRVNEGKVVVKVDGVVVNTTSGAHLDPLAQGEHLLRIESTDRAGNVGVKEVFFTVDLESPALALTGYVFLADTDHQTISGDIEPGAVLSAEMTAPATISAVGYPEPGKWSLDLANLAPGKNVVTLTARDAAGNESVLTQTLFRPKRSPLGAVAAGRFHNLRLRPDGTVTGWGSNSDGQATVPAGLVDVVDVAASENVSVALKKDGTLTAWGGGSAILPVDPVLNDVVLVAAGWNHALVVHSDGSVQAWGNNDSGQTAVPSGLGEVVAIAAGRAHSLALSADGTVTAWGDNSYGQSSVPSGLSGVVAVAAGADHSLALKADGSVVAWGGDGYGQSTLPAVPIDAVAVAAGYYNSLAVNRDGSVVAWGNNQYGQGLVPAAASGVVAVATAGNHVIALKGDGTLAGWGSNDQGERMVPADLSGIVDVACLATSCAALKADGSPLGWGTNGYGQLSFPPGTAGLSSISLGRYHAIALRYDGTVTGWGSSAKGQLPVPDGLVDVAEVSAGGFHNLAVKFDGSVRAWGDNSYGQCVVPQGLSDVYSVSAGDNFSVALKYDGTLIGWGDNSKGQTSVPAGNDFVAVAARSGFVIALRGDGTVVGWGDGTYGQTTPPADLAGVAAVSGGYTHALALKQDGTVVAWGDNRYGQTTIPAGLDNVVAIAAGAYYSVAVRSDGTVVEWGRYVLNGEKGSGPVVTYPPVTTPHPAPGVFATPQKVWLASAKDAQIRYTTDGSTPDTSSPLYTGAITVDSTTTIKFFAVSAAGDVEQVRSAVYVIDTAPPVISITSPLPGMYADAAPLLQYTINEGTAVVKVDGIVVGTPSGAALDALSVGDHLLRIEATDGVGNTSFQELAFSIDHQPPVLGFTWLPSFTPVPEQTLTGTRTEGSTLSVSLNGSAVAGMTYPDATTWSVTVSKLAEGENRLDFVLTSEFGKQRVVAESMRFSGRGRSAVRGHVSGGGMHTLRVKADGTVAAQGHNGDGKATVPPGLSDVVAVAAGYTHSLALKKDGTVVAWGSNWSGETTVPEGLSHVVAISAGCYFSVALRSDGTVVTWGDGNKAAPEGLSEVVSVSAGLFHSLAVRADGTVVAWGENWNGQTAVPEGLTDVVAVAGGQGHSLALKSDGTVAQWGYDFRASWIPEGLADVVDISAGDASSLALKADGTVVAWGGYGETSTVPAGTAGVMEIASGFYHNLALKDDGTLIAWGNNGYGQCTKASEATGLKSVSAGPFGEVAGVTTGNTVAQLASRNFPNQTAAGLSGVVSVSAGGNGSVALMGDGTVAAWGSPGTPIADLPAGLSGVAAVAAGSDHALALKTDGTIVGWGTDFYGETSVPTGLTSVRQIDAGGNYSLALLESGTVVSWGRQLGDPIFDTSTLSGVVAVAAGNSHALALKSDGSVVAWGYNTAGQTSVPEGLSGVTAIAAGSEGSLALKSDGTVVGWGAQAAQVPAGLKDVVAIAAGEFCIALKSDGTVETWGGALLPRDSMPTSTATTLPIATIHPASGSYSAAQQMTITANQEAVIHYTTDGSTPTASSPVYSGAFSITSDTTVRFVAVAADGTVGPVRSGSYVIDTVPPVVEIFSPTAGFINTTVPYIDYSISGGSAVVKMDGVVIGDEQWYRLEPLAQGSHLFRIEAKDAAGNTTVREVAFTVDSLPPSVDLGGFFITTEPHVVLRGTVEPGASFTATADSAALLGAVAFTSPGAWSLDVSALVPGKNVITFTATDAAGNMTEANKTLYYLKRSESDRIAAGASYTMRLNPDGTVTAWGTNLDGQVSVPSGLSGCVAVKGGDFNATALKSDGTVAAWGGSYGQEAVPSSLSDVVAIAAGRYAFLALKSDGTVVSWGDNADGNLTVPQGLDTVVAIAQGYRTSYALKADGTVVAWGDNSSGQVDVPQFADVVAVAAGHSHALALKSDGSVVAWGSNGYGESSVPAGLTGVVAVAAGGYGSLALKSDGTVVAWGDARYGQTQVPAGLADVAAITAGIYHRVALKSDGTIVSWGNNSMGECTVPQQLSDLTAVATRSSSTLALKSDGSLLGWGVNTYGQAKSPAGLADVSAVAAGTNHSLALRYDGTVVAWGDNGKGQAAVPAGLADVFAIAAGANHSLALKFDGSVVAWGDNGYGQSTVPAGLSEVSAVAAGDNFSVAVKRDGTLAGWGDNALGQLGFPSGQGIAAVAAGVNHVVALKIDGTVAAWGGNASGETDVPAGLTGVTAVAAGAAHSLALKADGTVVAWGNNDNGQIDVPAGLTGVTAIAAGAYTSIAVKSDGTLVEWGRVVLKGEGGSLQGGDIVPVTTPHPAPGTYAAAQTVWLSSSVKGNIHFTTDGSTPTTASAVYAGPISVPSTVTLRFFAVGSTGKAEEVKSAVYVIDTVAPTVTVTSPHAGLMNSDTPLLSYSVSDGTVAVTLDGLPLDTASGSNLSPVAQGTHLLHVQATDGVGNTAFKDVSFTVDSIPPSLAITQYAPVSNVTSQTVAGTVEAGAAVIVSVNTAASVGTVSYPAPGTWQVDITGLAADDNLVTVNAVDAAGNRSAASCNIRYNLAPIATSTTIVTADNTASMPVVPTVNGGNTLDIYTFAVLGQPLNGTASVVDGKLVYTPKTGYFGTDSFTYSVTDQGGLGITGTAYVVVNAANPAPVSGITATAGSDRAVRLAWTPSPSADAANYQVYWDNGSGTVSYAAPLATLSHPAASFVTAPLPDGVYRFVVRTKDASGLEEKNGSLVFARVDTTAPQPVANVTGRIATGNKVTVSWASSPATDVARYDIYTDNGTGSIDYGVPAAGVAADTLSYTTPSLTAGGTYRFAVIAQDGSGNRSTPSLSPQVSLAYPDLVVSSVTWTPDRFFFGDQVQFTARVTNAGTAPSGPQGFFLGFLLDNTLQFEQYFGGQILPGGYADIVVSKRMLFTARDYTLKVSADSRGSQVESDTTNNSFSAPFSITVDFLVAALADKPAYSPGAVIGISAQVANSSDPSLYLTPEKVTVTGVLVDAVGTPVAPEIPLEWQTPYFKAAYAIPSTLPTGSYRFKVIATGKDSGVAKSAFQEIKVVEGVTVEVHASKSRFDVGEPVGITGTVRTASGAPVASSAVTLTFKVKTITRMLNVTTGAGGEFNCSYRPDAGEGGLYEVQARSDANNLVTVAGTSFSVEGLYLSPQPGVNVASMSKNTTIALTGQFLLRNIGSEPVTGILLQVENTDQVPAVSATITSQNLPSVLEPGGSCYVDLAVSATLDAPAQSTLALKASADGIPAESLPSSLIRLNLVEPNPAPSVSPNAFTLGIAPGAVTAKQLTFTNGGHGVLHNVSIRPPAYSWISVADGNLGTVQPGESRVFQLLISPSVEQTYGTYDFPVEVESTEISARLVAAEVVVTSADKGNIKFYVTDDVGLRVPNATVSLVSQKDYVVDSPTGPKTYKNVVTRQSDAEGLAAFADIDLGGYDFQVDAASHDTVKGHVLINPGENKPDMVVNMTASLVSAQFTVVPAQVTDTYHIDASMTMVVQQSTPQAPAKPVLFLNPTIVEMSLKPEETYSGDLVIVSPNSGDLTNIVVDASTVGQKGLDFTFIQPGGVESDKIIIGMLPAQVELRLPFRARLRAGAVLPNGQVDVVTASGEYTYLDAITGAPMTGTTTAFASIRFQQPPVPIIFDPNVPQGAPISVAVTPSTILMTEYCSGWFSDSTKGYVANNTKTLKVTNTSGETITLSPAFGMTAKYSALDTVMNLFGAGVITDLWQYLNSGNPLEGVGSLWSGAFVDTTLAPGQSTELILSEYDPTLVGINFPDASISLGAAFFSYTNGVSAKPAFIPIAVTQLCTNGISIPVVQTLPVLDGYYGGGGDGWINTLFSGDPFAGIPDWSKVTLPELPPTPTTQEIVKIKLSQDAALEREVFKAELELTPLVVAMENLKVDLVFRNQSTGETATDLFNPVLTNVSGTGSINGAGTLAVSDKAVADWAILPYGSAGGDTPAGIAYEVRANISFTANGVNKSYLTEPVTITVKPEPLLAIDYYLKSAVDAEQPFQVKIVVKNKGKGVARNFRMNSAYPVITENTTGLPASFSMLGSGRQGEYNQNAAAITFGDIPPGGEVSGFWVLKSSLTGDFKEFKASYTHDNPENLPLTSVISELNTHILPSVHRYAAVDPSLIDKLLQILDPVDASSGAQLLERPLLTVHGVRDLRFSLSYNSLLTSPDIAGNGWGHNYETRLVREDDGTLAVAWSNNRRNSFVINGIGTFTSHEKASALDVIAENSDGTFTLRRKDGSKLLFNASGQLQVETNRTGQTIELRYGEEGRLSAVVEPVTGKSLGFSYNERGLLDKVTDPLGRQVALLYDPYNNLQSIIEPNGKGMTYSYDAHSRVLTGVDAEGNAVFTNTYDANGRVLTQDDALASTTLLTSFAYDDASGVTTVTNRMGEKRILASDKAFNLLSLQDELGNVTSYSYDNGGNRITATDVNGNVTHYSYDTRGNIVAVTDPKGRVTAMAYDAKDNLLSVTGPTGKTVRYYYDSNCRVVRTLDPLGNSVSYSYNSDGQLESMTDQNKGTTSYVYADGMLSSMTDPAGNSFGYSYDADGRIIGTTNPAGKTSTAKYDEVDNLIEAIDPLNRSVRNTYDSRHHLITSTDPAGNVTRYVYNGNGKVIKAIDPLGQETSFEYDAEDRLIKATDPRGHSVVTGYDAAGRAVFSTDALGNTRTTVYDPSGKVLAQKDAYGSTLVATEYDAKSYQPLSITDALSKSDTYGYDAQDRLTSVIDPLGHKRQMTYDDMNRLVSVLDAGKGTATQTFDANGNPTAFFDPNGNRTSFVYDAANRLTSVTSATGSVVTSYAGGLVDSVTNGRNQPATYRYYDDGRVKSVSDAAGSITYTYDVNGNILTVTEGTKVLSYQYDPLNRVTSYTDADGDTLRYGYDAAGNLTSLTYPDGKTVSYVHDAVNRLASVTDWAGRTTTYGYDKNGRLRTTTRPDGSVESREYDEAGQLIQLKDVKSDGVAVIAGYDFSYDAAGNVSSEASVTGDPEYNLSSATMTYGPDNMLLTFNGQGVEYDADGNMLTGPLSGGMGAFVYDARNRLVSAGGASYIYDAQNNRVSAADNGGAIKYVVNPAARLSQVLVEKNADSSVRAYYVYGLGLIGRQSADNAYHVYHFDRRGSTVALTDITGALTHTFSYGPFGECLSNGEGRAFQPFLYNGRDGVMTDTSGLYYMRARYYSPDVKRFINRDTLLGGIEDGGTLNRYGYLKGMPVDAVDPLGHYSIEDLGSDLLELGDEEGEAGNTFSGVARDWVVQPGIKLGAGIETIFEANGIGYGDQEAAKSRLKEAYLDIALTPLAVAGAQVNMAKGAIKGTTNLVFDTLKNEGIVDETHADFYKGTIANVVDLGALFFSSNGNKSFNQSLNYLRKSKRLVKVARWAANAYSEFFVISALDKINTALEFKENQEDLYEAK